MNRLKLMKYREFNNNSNIYLFFFQTIADVIRTSLGPRAMLKMLMDPMGGIVMTNDGNAILRSVFFRKIKHFEIV